MDRAAARAGHEGGLHGRAVYPAGEDRLASLAEHIFPSFVLCSSARTPACALPSHPACVVWLFPLFSPPCSQQHVRMPFPELPLPHPPAVSRMHSDLREAGDPHPREGFASVLVRAALSACAGSVFVGAARFE